MIFDSGCQVGWVFTHGQGDQGSIPGRILPKTQILDTSFLKIQHYKVHINGKVEQSRECNGALPNTSM